MLLLIAPEEEESVSEDRSEKQEESTTKRLKALSEDGELILQFVVAEKLGYTVSELQERMTQEELWMWSIFYDLRADQEKEAMDKAKRKRR